MTINPADPRPPYQQLADELRAALASGELGPGDPLPSVRDLAARYRVSNTTASRAIESLKAEGLVDTRPGRGNVVRSKRPVLYVGSYLSADSARGRTPWHLGLAEQGFTGTQQITDVATVALPAEIAERLNLPTGALGVVRRRVLSVDATPVQLSDSYYPATLAEGTELASPKKLRGYSFAALERLGVKIDHFQDDLYARMPTPAEARLLHLGKGTPVVRLLRVTFADGNTPVEVADQILASDRYVLSYEIPGTVSGTQPHRAAEPPARG